MCCVSGPVEQVSETKIFARPIVDGRQVLVYEMAAQFRADLAMILPLPVPPAGPDDAVQFVELSDEGNFFPTWSLRLPEEA